MPRALTPSELFTASLEHTAFKMAVLLSVLFLLSVESGFGLKQTCLPVCSEGDCITMNWAKVDFDTAEEACRRRNGELLTLQSETHQRIFKTMAEALQESFWMGLRLPAGSCSSLSEPLRGYMWTSGSTNRTFNSSLMIWEDSLKVCSPHCISLSEHQIWTERPCSDKPDGFLCRTEEKNACWEPEIFFKSSTTCKSAPCEQTCKNTKGGFKCSCFKGYIPDSSDPRRCRLHCPQKKCSAICPGSSEDACFCADGFVENERMCEDIDECEMDRCQQGCVNTFGSFLCFCKMGFVLKDEMNCIAATKSEHSAELTIPTYKNTTLRVSSVPAVPFLWIWIVAAVTLVASVLLIRLYVVRRQKRREQNSNQQRAAPADHPDS